MLIVAGVQYLDAGRLCADRDGHSVCARLPSVESVVLPAEVRHGPPVPARGECRSSAAETVPGCASRRDRGRETRAAQLGRGGRVIIITVKLTIAKSYTYVNLKVTKLKHI